MIVKALKQKKPRDPRVRSELIQKRTLLNLPPEQDFINRLKKIRIITDQQNTKEYRLLCYEKYKHIIPHTRNALEEYSDQEIQEILIAEQLYWRDQVLDRLKSGSNKDEYNKPDLVSLLKKPVQEGWDSPTELGRTQQGLDFLKPFVRHLIYQTKVKGKYPDPTKNVDEVRSFHRAICLVYELNPNIDRMSLSKLTTVIQLTGSVLVVSNFRPLSAAAIWQKYAIDCNPDKKEINILAPSEGFFGRLLSSYYIAYHNRDKVINYHSFDPNTELKAPSEKIINYLKNYGNLNRIDNWNPNIHWHGSEVPEADLHKRLGIKFDCIFTSPPYGLHEIYVNTSHIHIVKETDNLSALIKSSIPIDGKLDIIQVQDASEYFVGQKIQHKGSEWVVAKINSNTQSHSKVNSTDAWRELFFRETVRNCKNMLIDDGYMIWNVANTKTYPNLEADVLRVCDEEGFDLIETLHYVLSRRPGENNKPVKDENGNLIKGKPPYEPVFVFKKRS